MIARGLRALVVATLALALCGCAPESPNPPFTASGAPTAPTAARVDPGPVQDGPVTEVDCVGGHASLAGESLVFRMSVPCARVDVAGENLEVRLTNDVRGDLGSLTVQGNSNAVTATALGAVTDQGEANSIAPR